MRDVSALHESKKKDGKDHRYFSVVENQRVSSGKTVQRTVLYLGEINDTQQTAWLKTLDVFDEQEQRSRELSLFPDDREIPTHAVDSLQVKLSGLELRRPRAFGNCWMACELWRELGLEGFWQQRLPAGREEVSWEKVLRLLVVSRWIEPGSEFRVHRHWFLNSAMDELLGVDFAVAEKDRLYRCLDRLLEHKQDLFVWLRQKWADLFHADFEVLLYDLTSTYFEGEMENNSKAKRGYSRDGRPDCLQLVIALVITTDGFPLAYEVMDGNTSDRTTLRSFLDKIENTYGKAKRMWVMDRGIPTDEILAEMRDPDRQMFGSNLNFVFGGLLVIASSEKEWTAGGAVGTVVKPELVLAKAFPNSLWESSRRYCRRRPLSISTAVAVSTALPASGFLFFVFCFEEKKKAPGCSLEPKTRVINRLCSGANQ